MNRKKLVFGLIGLTATIIGFAAKIFYRNYIFTNSIEDFGLADALPSLFYVIGFSQLLLIKPPVKPGVLITMVALASSLFEIRQYYTYGIADYFDIIASVTGGLISFFIWRYVERKFLKT